MYNVINLKTNEIYNSFETLDEANNWIECNCDDYNDYGKIDYPYSYNGNTIAIDIV